MTSLKVSYPIAGLTYIYSLKEETKRNNLKEMGREFKGEQKSFLFPEKKFLTTVLFKKYLHLGLVGPYRIEEYFKTFLFEK